MLNTFLSSFVQFILSLPVLSCTFKYVTHSTCTELEDTCFSRDQRSEEKSNSKVSSTNWRKNNMQGELFEGLALNHSLSMYDGQEARQMSKPT
jgi:hypothetical protein